MLQDQFNSQKGVLAFDAATINSNTTTQGNSVDRKGFQSVTLHQPVKTVTDGDFNYKVMESDDDVSFSEADSDFVITNDSDQDGAWDSSDSDSMQRIGYVGHKRYVRFDIVSTNVSTGGDVGDGIAVLGNALDQPV